MEPITISAIAVVLAAAFPHVDQTEFSTPSCEPEEIAMVAGALEFSRRHIESDLRALRAELALENPGLTQDLLANPTELPGSQAFSMAARQDFIGYTPRCTTPALDAAMLTLARAVDSEHYRIRQLLADAGVDVHWQSADPRDWAYRYYLSSDGQPLADMAGEKSTPISQGYAETISGARNYKFPQQ